jgi:hypothetical protein
MGNAGRFDLSFLSPLMSCRRAEPVLGLVALQKGDIPHDLADYCKDGIKPPLFWRLSSLSVHGEGGTQDRPMRQRLWRIMRP